VTAHHPSSERELRRSIVRNRRGLATRRAILNAAQRLLREQGFEALSLDAVARAASISRSSVYHQFESRDGLFLTLVADSLRRVLARRRRARGASTRLQRFMNDAESAILADSELMRMFFRLTFDRRWNRAAMRRVLRDAYRRRTENIVDGLVKDRTALAAADLETVAVLIAAAIDGLYARHLIDPQGDQLRGALALLHDMVVSLSSRR
jgi:AcrR family transcriptional regulator